jgi:Flp pilus assembly protein TadG
MTNARRNLARSEAGATAAEFAIVLPLFLILLFGIIDAGRYLWQYNEAEKATQVGVRLAVVTNVLSSGLENADYTGQTIDGVKIQPGGVIPAGALGTMVCTSTGCTCDTSKGAVDPCPDPGTFDSDTFNNVLVARMQQIDPTIQADNVVVRYSGSGLGFASAGQMEISPLTTVSLQNMKFVPITSFLFAQITMPELSATLTSEDASGSYSN